MVTSTRRRPGSSRSQGNAGSAGRSVSTGPTAAWCAGTGPGPVSAGPVKASTRAGEKRGSTYSSSGSPARRHRPSSRPVIHSSSSGSPRNGRPSSIAPGARVPQGSRCRCATSAPAGVCWSTSSASGRNSRTAASSALVVNRAYGTMKPSHSERTAASPWPPCARNARVPVPNTVASGPSSGRSAVSVPVQATSWPRATSSRARPTVGLTCPVRGGTTSRKRLIGRPPRAAAARRRRR